MIRDEVIDVVQNRKKVVTLNFQIGSLVLSPNNNVQFKSLSIAEATSRGQQASTTTSVRLTEASLRGLENGSRTGSQKNLDERTITERSINYMQSR